MTRQGLVVFILVFVLLSFGEAQRPQSIPIGMFNAYLPEEGNLAQSIPDLREVWEGMPEHWQGGNFPFEACNLVQHYWPDPIPPSTTGEDPYLAWTKHFLSEVYRQGHLNGEVRLRAIVGDLFTPYVRFGEAWLRMFIRELCAWEASGPHDGVIAGWYLVEEPMGGSHNYDVNAYEQMVQILDEVEREGGFRRHDRYMDTGVDGKYLTPTKFARFTRPADVIMVSSSSYIWLTARTQPVYTPQWDAFPYILNFVRRIVEPDRKAHGLPMPQIHIVLQGAELRRYRPTDQRSYGQPTNWEMRQQIRRILTPDWKYTGQYIAPADGFWIFWWPGLTLENEDKVDDWVHGRRLAEAIEMEVAELTGHAHEVRSPYTPKFTRFLFPPDVPFNPNESNIPYELARSGRVQVEVRRPNGVLVERFDMGVQSAGRLERFGGPAWRPGSEHPDGRYTFILYLDGERMDTVTVDVRTRAALSSPSHKTGFWNRQNQVEVVWSPPASVEGIVGYAYSWDQNPAGFPGRTVQLSPEVTALRSEPLPDGDNHYFHLRHVDAQGNWSDTATLGPFWIDATPPAFQEPPQSPSHTPGKWSSEPVVQLRWQPPQDPHSGLYGYALVWDHSPVTEPEPMLNVGSGITQLESPPLSDGEWFAHLRAGDRAGNWSPTVHLGPFRIDTTPPDPPRNLQSASHPHDAWSAQPQVTVRWDPAEDASSGIKGYRGWWDDAPESDPPADALLTADTHLTSPPLADGIHWFHVQALDRAGNASAVRHLGPFPIDTTPPQPGALTMHRAEDDAPIAPQDWIRTPEVRFRWQPGTDELSGVAETFLRLERSQPAPLRQEYLLSESEVTLSLSDGVWRVQLIFRDRAGNESTVGQILRIDTQGTPAVVQSSTHPDPMRWYASPQVEVRWTPPSDLSGIQAYRWSVDVPPGQAANPRTAAQTEARFTLDSGEHTFYLLTVDGAGNEALTRYPIRVDARPPAAPRVQSATHPPATWIPRAAFEARWQSDPPLSGIAGYAVALDAAPDTQPTAAEWTSRPSFERTLPDGVWYLHVRQQSGSGLWSPTAHYEVRVDTTSPQLHLTSPSHPDPDAWSADRQVTFLWDAEDAGSGIARYRWGWANVSVAELTETLPAEANRLVLDAPGDGVFAFHLQAEDAAGNRSPVQRYAVRIDARAPERPTIHAPTHPPEAWTSQRQAQLHWSSPPNPSGIAGYSFLLDASPASVPDDQIDTAETALETSLPGDGVFYFHLRARSGAGLWGSAAHYTLRVDTMPPEIAITRPISDAWSDAAIREYQGWARDALAGVDWDTLEYRYGDAPWHPFRNDMPLMAAEGPPLPDTEPWIDTDEIPDTEDTPGIPLQVRVRDRAGNLGLSPVVLLRIDTQRPTLTLSSPTHPISEIPSRVSQPRFVWQVTSGPAPITQIRWGLTAQAGGIPEHVLPPGTREWTLDPLPDGRWVFQLVVRNAAGKESEIAHWPLWIDTTPPVATLRWEEPLRQDRGPQRSPRRLGVGRVRLWLTLSEPLREDVPYLAYQMEGYAPQPLSVKASPDGVWESTLDILPPHFPQGKGRFLWRGTDLAGNVGEQFEGEVTFWVQTVLEPSAAEAQQVASTDGASVEIPPGALPFPAQIALLPVPAPSAKAPGRVLAGYEIRAFSPAGQPLALLDLSLPARLFFPGGSFKASAFWYDGVQFHPVRGGWDAPTRRSWAEVRQIGAFYLVEGSTGGMRRLQGGWATPNPFTPNGSGDPSDRTVIHVRTATPQQSFQVMIYDLRGRRVRTLPLNENAWDGRDDQGRLLETGVYVFQVRAGDEVLSGSVVLVR